MLRFTAKGRIQVWDGEVLVSSHVQEREAYERIAGLAPGKYTVTFPVIEVVSSGAFQGVYSTSSELGRVEARGMAVQVVRLLSDTTPPAVPSGFSATASTATTVTLTLTANGESDFSNYVLERSSDNIGWGYLKSFTGTSTTDTVDVSGSTYYYRAFSIDTRGNRSAYTAVKSAGPYTVSFAWNGTVPNVTFTRGNSQNFDLSPYIIGSSPTITVETGTLPSGVTLNSAQQRLQYDGSSATSTSIVATGISLRLSTSAEADWQTRIGESGVVWYHAFESDAEINQFRWAGGYSGGNDPQALSGDAGYMTRSASGGPGNFPYLEVLHPVGTAPNVNWWRPFSALRSPGNGRATDDPAAGKPLRTWNPTNGSSTTQGWAQDFYGPTTHPQTFYLQMRVMTDPRRFQSSPTAVGKKWFLTTTTNSLTSQELVTYSGTQYHRMYYGGSPPLEDGDTLSRPGQQVGGDLSSYPSNYCDVGTNPGRCWQFGLNQWDTILHEITPGTSTSSPTSTVRIYAANAGQTSYTKIWDLQFTHGWDAVNQYGWNAILFNSYQNGLSFSQPFWQRYAQLIFSTSFIPCPQV